MTLRLVFMGTPAFAVPTLVELIGQGHEVAAVYTQPPRPAGRGMAERRSAVHEQAALLELPVATPERLDAAATADFAALEADAAVVVAYGLILPQPVLDAPEFGCLNLHASLLPRWRGAAPVQRAIMAGDAETGVMVMRMDSGLDTGPVCMAERTPIGDNETAGALAERLSRLGADLMARAVGALSRGALNCVPQAADGVAYARKIDKAEARIDWARPAAEVHNHVRGLSPFPGAWCEMATGGNGERVKVLATEVADGSAAASPPGTVLDAALTVACRTGAVRLTELQRAGKRPVAADAFLRGAPLKPGDRLG